MSRAVARVTSGTAAVRRNLLDHAAETLELRCSWQAADYCGRLGGRWPSGSGDVFICLRNALEDVVC